ncbi:MAG: mannitol dehydrogenase, partial [Bacteroidetes bacterium]|nr:mannitol dehydrogenase [Bacteroidota bacterium]
MLPRKKKILIFGAGKIGRSFIGQLFGCGGYEVVFIDISKSIIYALNHQRKYPVFIKDVKENIIWVNNVRGVLITDTEKILTEISDT